MMDSIYAPRPFTRTPRSYRSLNDAPVGYGLRSFGSMSALGFNDNDDDTRSTLPNGLRHQHTNVVHESLANLHDARGVAPHRRDPFDFSGAPLRSSIVDGGSNTRASGHSSGYSGAHLNTAALDQFSVDTSSNLSSRASSPMNRYPPPTTYHYQHQRGSFASPINSTSATPTATAPHSYYDEAPVTPVYDRSQSFYNRTSLPPSGSHYEQQPGASYYDGPRSPREDEFLQRLREQKLSVGQPPYSQPFSNSVHQRDSLLINGTLPRNEGSHISASYHHDSFPYHDDFDPWEHRPNGMNGGSSNGFSSAFDSDSTLERAYNRALHKTRSDSHLMNDVVHFDRFGNRRVGQSGQQTRHYGTLEHKQHLPPPVSHSFSPPHLQSNGGNLLERAINNTAPFQNMDAWNDTFSDSDFPSSIRSVDSQMHRGERIIPIQIGSGDRVLKIDSEDLMHYTPTSRYYQPPHELHEQRQFSHSQPHIGSPLTSWPQSPAFGSPITSNTFQNTFATQSVDHSPNVQQRTVFSPVQANTFYGKPPQLARSTYSNHPLSVPVQNTINGPTTSSPPPPVPPSVPTTSAPPPPPPLPTQTQPVSNIVNPIGPLQVQSTQNTFARASVQDDSRNASSRAFSPTREHPLIPRHVHEEILNVIPNRAIRHPPAIARSLQPVNSQPINPIVNARHATSPEQPTEHGPVTSQMFNGSGSARNSVIQLGSVTELGYITSPQGGDKRASMIEPSMSASYPAPANINSNRSFAIVSRPLSPQATIVQPVHPVQPTVQQAIVEHPQKATAILAKAQPDMIPRSPPANLTGAPRSPPGNGTGARVLSPAQMAPSPIGSVYDNATDEDKPRSPIARIAAHRLSSPPPPPHGILVKKEENTPAARAQKKVAFQVDDLNDDEQNAYKKKQMGWADLGLSIYDCCSPCTTNGVGEGGSSAPTAGSAEAPAQVREYNDAIDDALATFLQRSEKIGGDCLQAAKQFKEVFDLLRDFLWKAAGQPEPEQQAFASLLAPIQAKMQALNEFRESKRNTPHFNHISALAEAIQSVGWVTVKPTPAPFVKEMLEAAKFFTNRVRKDHKDSGPQHIEWVSSLEELVNALYTFVRKVHTTGLVWNSAPGAAPPAAAAPSAGGPPPPPPPPPADFMVAPTAGDKDKSSRDALFAQLNQGEAITNKLKKVTSDMQTHKNPSLRAASTVPATAAAGGTAAAPKAATPAVQKPPKLELENGKQWNVEYFKNDKNVVVNVADKKQTVYIFKCENCTIRVNGKCNSITLDQCKKTAIAFDAIVAQVETINCQSLQIQTLGEMPTVSIQKTDGCQIYLSQASVGAEIVTSKSSEMNVLVPGGPDGDFVEYPVPEQFKTVYRNGKLETSVSDIV